MPDTGQTERDNGNLMYPRKREPERRSMVTILKPLLEESVAFDEAATHAITVAYDEICREMKLPADAQDERQQIAMRVLDLARTGVIDAHALRERVIEELKKPL